MLEGDADEVQFAERRLRLERNQRQAAVAQQRCHVGPGQKRPLTRRVRTLIDDVIENAGAEVGHAHLVDIGVREGHAAGHRGPLHDLIPLPADIAGRLLHLTEQLVQLHTPHIRESPGHAGASSMMVTL